MKKPETNDDLCLEINDLNVHFALRGSTLSRLTGKKSGVVRAVDGVSFRVPRGSVVGLVGESGSGKTTLGRALLGLAPITSGEAIYHPREGSPQHVDGLKGQALRSLRTDIQMVFQDPHAALNPSMTVETAVGHPLVIHGAAKGEELKTRVVAALERVGLAPAENFLGKYPSDLSGGQKQRAVIARAIIMNPEVLVADEPVSMLDMSVRAKILELMLELKEQLKLTYVYITHDLATAKFFCDHIAIMYLGKIVEFGPTEEIFANPRHPYTQALLNAIPDIVPGHEPRALPSGEIPDAAHPPLGCSFHPRCPVALATCGWEGRDVRSLLEQHWTTIPVDAYEQELRIIGDLSALAPEGRHLRLKPAHGTVDDVWQIIERLRRDTDAHPLWRGVTSMVKTDDGVVLEFADFIPLRDTTVGDVSVRCLLHQENAKLPLSS